MIIPDSHARISTREYSRKYTYNGTNVLSLSMTYPAITLKTNRNAQIRINSFYRSSANAYYHNVSNNLYNAAVLNYNNSKENNFPFNPFDAVMNYTDTYNKNFHLSTFTDKYEYAGGAHGSTIRYSVTFLLKSGRKLSLSQIFKPDEDYKKLLLNQIIHLADANIRQNPGIYFSNYRELIAKNFNPESFYLTDTGISFYYLQYEIAPYATGVVVFNIPYEKVKWQPVCK